MNVIKESYKYCKKYTGAWLFVVFCGALHILIMVLLPQVPQLIIDRIINPALGQAAIINPNNVFSWVLNDLAADAYVAMFLRLLIVFGLLLFLRYGGHYARWNVSHYFGCKAEKDMRMAVFSKMLNQNTMVLNRYTSGDLMSIANSDPVQVKNCYSETFSILLDQIMIIIMASLFLFQIHWSLMILPLSVGIMTSVIMFFYIRTLRVRYNEIRESSVAINSCVQENINGVRIVRAFATEEKEVGKFTTLNNNYYNSFVRQTRTVAFYNMWFNGLGQAINLGSMVLGVLLAVKGTISLGMFVTFLSYVGMINGPLVAITNIMGNLQNAMICGNRMFTFLKTSNVICDPPLPKTIEGSPNISLRNVTVSLEDGTDLCEELKEINLEIPYGKKLGIMGKTGSGKSVLMKTLARFYETTRGETCINGINVKDFCVDDVRRQFSFVMQDVFLFSNTVDSNIAFYDLDAPHEDVIKAAKVAEADGFINKLSEGYDTVVGERGLGLSGGQKQRISIARALLKNAPVLMFDDCTSALDMETERKILNAVRETYAEKTLVISSHRAASVENCDEILFLEGGQIAERGTHQELMAKKGKYYEVYTKQAATNAEAVA